MRNKIKISIFALFAICMMCVVCGELNILQGSDIINCLSDLLLPSGGALVFAAGPGVTVQGTVEVGDLTGEGKDHLDEVLKREIVKVRPSDTPLDTLTRELDNSENAPGIEVGGWEIGTRDIDDQVKTINTAGEISAIPVKNIGMWLPGDLLQVPAITGADGKPLTCYIIDRGSDGASVSVRAINGTGSQVPAIPADSSIYRIGTAGSETQAQAESYAINPSKRKNNCQLHITQVEESVVHGLHKKKADMDFGVYREQTLWDFKRSMELTNLFGVKGVTQNKKNELVYTSDGLWNQLAYETQYAKAGITDAEWVKITREIFEGNNGAEKRILLTGPGFLESIANVKSYQKQLEAKNVEIVLGVRVQKIETNFGELLIKNMGTLFSGERSYFGMALDLGYIIKKVFEPLQTEMLDLNRSGQKRVKACRIFEHYCLYAENLPAHRKLTPKE